MPISTVRPYAAPLLNFLTKEYGLNNRNVLVKMLMDSFPEYGWDIKKVMCHMRPISSFQFSKNSSLSIQQQKDVIEEIAKANGWITFEDYYSLDRSKLKHHPDGLLLLKIYDEPSRIMEKLYPEHNWKRWKFWNRTEYWSERSNQREFFDDLSKKLDIKRWEDWYEVKHQQVLDHGGQGFITVFGSYMRAIANVYRDDFKFQLWRFRWVPNNFWRDVSNQRSFLDSLAIDLGIKKHEDWYNVSAHLYICVANYLTTGQ